ncbi:Glycosyltransferase involved in cell wall bisynthesis [Nakamurella panacisegetis]|uniref:4,4'-diaponeurosporenoate glycosyltransferase n=1 Tax=Nakamurella panacisegetis TaxID=1090615 RepID=A0A1H0IWC1_9ACTN|nr:glycosyltransferase family A protein [Nakamurella panacisegetis]SDO35788.1 Glycosyltransferase involved in cell wall bisynthesis [Nakamurella panacisegetis]
MVEVSAGGAVEFRYSVVIPAFNEEFYLADTLASLAAQNFAGDVEIIVVDNNSTDRTAAIAEANGATVVFESERGVCHARQRGTELARGEIVVSADADTVYHPDWLSTIEAWFVAHPFGIAVGGPCYFHDGPAWGLWLQRRLFGVVNLVARLGGPVIYITATNFAFRRDAFRGYDTRLAQGGDELDLLRGLRKQGLVAFDPNNAIQTSARRMEEGVVYNFAVSFFYYYILGYALNRIFRRPILGMAPAFRRAKGNSGTRGSLSVDGRRDG